MRTAFVRPLFMAMLITVLRYGWAGGAEGDASSADGLRICRFPEGKSSMVTLTFDDGVGDHYTVAAPLLEKNGLRGTFYIIANRVGTPQRMNWQQIRELGERGHEIGNHSETHPHIPKLLTAGDWRRLGAETAGSRDRIAAETGFMPRTYCYPGNSRNADTDLFLLRSHWAVLPPRVQYGTKTTMEKHRTDFARMREPGRHTVLMIHGITPEGGGWDPFADPEVFPQLLTDLAACRDSIHVATFAENVAYERRRDATVLNRLGDREGWAAYRVDMAPEADVFRGRLWLSLGGGNAEVLVNGQPPIDKRKNSDGTLLFAATTGDIVLVADKIIPPTH